MTALMLIATFLAPVVCPPDIGNVRWNEFTFAYTLEGAAYDVRGPLWDRDRDSKPSPGDIMRIDTATTAGVAASIEPLWIMIDGPLAAAFAAHYLKDGDKLDAVCETRFEIEEVPKLSTDVALAKLLRERDAAVPKMSVEEQAEKAMLMWAEERCNREKYADDAALRTWLLKNGTRTFNDLGQPRLKKMAADVARRAGSKCAHLKGPKISF